MSTFPQSSDPNYPSTSGFYADLYGGLMPDAKTLYTMARNSYVSPQTPEKMADIPTYHVALKTPTLTIYEDNMFFSFVVAIRGTADWTDFKAWLPTATNTITSTNRWQKDYNDLLEFQKRFPPSKYVYYGVGHSLGGEIMDQFIKRGMIDSGRSYNPAIQTGDIPSTSLAKKNARIYASGDPLYKLEGQFNHPTEVRPSPPAGWVASFTRLKDQHSLLNPLFEGGAGTDCPPFKALPKLPKSMFDDLYEKLNQISLYKHISGNMRKGFNKGASAVFGLTSVRRIKKGEDRVRISAYAKKYPEITKELFRIGKKICPFPFKSVYVNHNVQTPRHKDTGNTDLALIVSFGDYKGGLLMVDDKPADTYLRPILFDGSKYEHYNKGEITGNKYSLVFYNNTRGQ
jgi:hypothetical protein